MNYGSTLYIRLQDRNNNDYYVEPFTITQFTSYHNFKEAIGIFEDNAHDALKEILQDIEHANNLKDIPDHVLIGALRSKGYTITK